MGRSVDKLCWGNSGQVRGPTSSTRCSGRLGPGSEGPQCRPNLLGDSGSRPRSRGSPAVLGEPGPFPRARRFDQLFRPTRTRVPGAVGSTSYDSLLGVWSELSRGQPAFTTDSDPGLTSCVVDQLSRSSHSRVRGAARRPAVPAESDPGPNSCGVNHLSRPTGSQVRVSAGWTSCPGRLGRWSEELWGRQCILADSVPPPSCRIVNLVSLPTPS